VSGLPYYYVRGAPPSAVGYFIDDVRVPYLFHFALGPGVIQPSLIEEVSLHPAAFPARYGRYAGAIVAVAGPLVNVALCAVSIVLLVVFLKFGVSQLPEHVAKNVVVLLSTMAYLNLALVLLNLIPLPPLDGSRILADFSPQYRGLIADPTMQGVFFACTIAVLIFGGRFILPFAQDTVNSTLVGLLRVVGV